jgi:hypothetical protein
MHSTAAANAFGERPPDSGPATRSAAHAPHPLPQRYQSSEQQLPSVIVNLQNDCRLLVERLCEGELHVVDDLLQLGEPAVTALVMKFPGPITSELRRGATEAPARASECGPVLQALARFGPMAAPFLVTRAADPDPIVRSWTTRLLGEIPSIKSAHAVAARFLDRSLEVRRAALAAGRLLQSDAQAASTLREGLMQTAANASNSDEARHTAVQAVADLRDGEVVPALILLLDNCKPSLFKSVHWALVVLTRQDFGKSSKEWTSWWEGNKRKHRIQWLIDALLHDSPEIRRLAGDELKSLTKEYFGYYDDLPKKERARAQLRYLEWWENTGKERFGL